MSDLLKDEPLHARLLAKLETHWPLSHADRQALYDLPIRTRTFKAGEDMVLEGDRPTECCLVLEGLVGRYKLVSDGRRQILAFHVPGDIPDLHSLQLTVMDHSLGALSQVSAAFIPHADLRALLRRAPAIADSLWRETLIDGAVFREWMVGMGRRSAYARLAHLFCELATKIDQTGGRRGDRYPFPLTQSEVGDALGLSTVHVNRMLQLLRKAGAIQVRAGEFKVLDWDVLAAAGEFNPVYLHLGPTRATNRAQNTTAPLGARSTGLR